MLKNGAPANIWICVIGICHRHRFYSQLERQRNVGTYPDNVSKYEEMSMTTCYFQVQNEGRKNNNKKQGIHWEISLVLYVNRKLRKNLFFEVYNGLHY